MDTEQKDVTPPEHVVCPRCGRPVDATDRFCRACGRKLGESSSWLYHPWTILFLALVVVGPFAIILVWKAPNMSPGVRAVLAVVIIAYTIVCFYLSWEIFIYTYRHFKELGEIMNTI